MGNVKLDWRDFAVQSFSDMLSASASFKQGMYSSCAHLCAQGLEKFAKSVVLFYGNEDVKALGHSTNRIYEIIADHNALFDDLYEDHREMINNSSKIYFDSSYPMFEGSSPMEIYDGKKSFSILEETAQIINESFDLLPEEFKKVYTQERLSIVNNQVNEALLSPILVMYGKYRGEVVSISDQDSFKRIDFLSKEKIQFWFYSTEDNAKDIKPGDQISISKHDKYHLDFDIKIQLEKDLKR